MPCCKHGLAAALIDDPLYRTATVACGDDDAARLAMLEAYFALALTDGGRGASVLPEKHIRNAACLSAAKPPAA